MRVRVKRMGYYALVRRNEGEVFEMSETAMKKDAGGKAILPTWVDRASGVPESAPKGTVKVGVPDKSPGAKAQEPAADGDPEVVI